MRERGDLSATPPARQIKALAEILVKNTAIARLSLSDRAAMGYSSIGLCDLGATQPPGTRGLPYALPLPNAVLRHLREAVALHAQAVMLDF